MSAKEQLTEEVEKLLDESDKTPQDKKLTQINGVLYPGILCTEETFKALESFEAREDDLMLVSYPKCGTTWSLNLLNDMVQTIYNKDPPNMIQILEFGAPDKYELLVVFRNPKDTAVSFFHFYNKNPMLPNYSSWDTFFEDFIGGKVCWGSYFDHALAWNQHIDDDDVLIMTFEEMKEDLEAAVKKISEFYGFSMSDEQVHNVAEKGTFTAMKEKLNNIKNEFAQIFLRKGEVGDWKNHFSEAQSQEIDAKFEACLAGTKLGDMLKYNVYCK
ncbi:sulfotransferase 6B1 isoform X2 [Xenopus laevis]|uniref:Sulfotransferase n=1 Tax=Xenopus laevis TaxID=8355 RepID=A0A8J0VG11_XENLA|nr:sulfotransferase 6B1 isoform X2 [Xenopus laevis]